MCLNPLRAEPSEFGRPTFTSEGSLLLPCGKCDDCKKVRAADWALRAKHEIASHPNNIFLTLTYDEDHLPSKLVVKEYYQKFIKKLRKKLPYKIKHMVSHEYGGKNGRPHHHCIIFGYEPETLHFKNRAPSGHPTFTSPEIKELWQHGFHECGFATAAAAYYIAAYSLKATSHQIQDDHGEIITVKDSFDCSRRTAIGYEYFLKHMEQIVENERLPRYYKTLLERFGHDDLLMKYEQRMLTDIQTDTAHQKLARHNTFLSNLNSSESLRDSKKMTKEDYHFNNYLKRQRIQT